MVEACGDISQSSRDNDNINHDDDKIALNRFMASDKEYVSDYLYRTCNFRV